MMKSKTYTAPLDVISYWRSIEEFTPHKIEEEKLSGNVQSILREVFENEDIPWLNHQHFKHQNDEVYVWIYTVFLGIISIENITREIIRQLEFTEQSNNSQKSEGVSCICSFQVNTYGQIIQNSLKISDWFVGIVALKKDCNETQINSKIKVTNQIQDIIHNLSDRLNQNNEKNQKISFEDLKNLTENCIEVADYNILWLIIRLKTML